jgi:hypothetical protein
MNECEKEERKEGKGVSKSTTKQHIDRERAKQQQQQQQHKPFSKIHSIPFHSFLFRDIE